MRHMMKILFVINSLAGGGAQRLVSDLTVALSLRNHICSLLVLNNESDKYSTFLISNGISLNYVPKGLKTHFSKIKYIRKFILSGSFDVVHANLFPTIYYCAMSKFLGKKLFPTLLMTEHSTDNHRRHKWYLRPIEKFIYRKYDYVISISKKTEEALLRWLKTKKKSKFVVVENGVVLSNFKNAKAADRKTISKELNNNDILLCLVGSFTEQKNHKMAIAILKELPNNYKLVLLGEGKLKDSIVNDISAKNLTDRVFLMGFRNDVASIVKACDIILIPSKWEGFSLVAVEGMACGLPIVASNVDGLSDVVSDYGFVCDDNVDAYSKAIRTLENKTVYLEYIKKSICRAEEYDISTTTKGYETIFSSAVNCKEKSQK